MEFDALWPGVALLLLGAVHGVNPGMGWLFAVALGLQEEDRRVVWRSLLPLGLGHALAIAAALVVAGLLGQVVPVAALKWLVGALLLGFGAYKLARRRHPRYGGMLMSFRKLTVWSFLMGSAHGAGLMVLPIVLGAPAAGGGGSAEHGAHGLNGASLAGLIADGQLTGLGATAIHTLGYLLVSGLIAVIVYEKLGLRLLRSAWIDLDSMWAVALIVTGVATFLI